MHRGDDWSLQSACVALIAKEELQISVLTVSWSSHVVSISHFLEYTSIFFTYMFGTLTGLLREGTAF